MAVTPRYKDSLYSWIVALAVFFGQFLFGSIYAQPSLYIIEYTEAFPDTPLTLISVAGSIFRTLECFLSIPVGYLAKRFGPKCVGLVGGLFMGLGTLVCAFAPNIYVIWIFYGVFGGFGSSCFTMANIVIMPQVFQRQLGLANSLVQSGVCLAQILFVPLLRLLIDYYGWRGSHAVHAAMLFNGCVCAMMYNKSEEDKVQLSLNGTENTEAHQVPCDMQIQKEEDHGIEELEVEEAEKKSCFQQTTQAMNLNLLCNVDFIMYTVAHTIIKFSVGVVLLITAMAVLDDGMDKMAASMLNAVVGGSVLLGAIVFGILANFRRTSRTILHGISFLLLSISVLLCLFVDLFHQYVYVCILYGVGFAGYLSLKHTVLVDLFGRDVLALSYGWSNAFSGVANIVVMPFFGFMRDYYGTFDNAFYAAGALGIVAGLMLIAVGVKNACSKKPERVPSN